MTRKIITTAYNPHTRAPADQPTNYARTLLILALAAAGLGEIDEAAAAGVAALESGHVVWPTMVLAGKLDPWRQSRPVPRTRRISVPGTSTQARGWHFPQRQAVKGTPVSDVEPTTALAASVDIDAPPPDTVPCALVLFGTNQAAPARIAADRYRCGLAPLIIATGGINRHNGIVEGREFARQLAAADVPASAVRVEDQSKDTWQNVELSMPYLREALAMGLPLVAVSKWYHLRAVYCLRTQLPEAVPLFAIGWEPVYAGVLVTWDNWPSSPDGHRRVIREFQEVQRRVAEGSYLPAVKKDGAWSLCFEPFPFDHAKLAGDRALVAVRLTRPADALAAFTESLSAAQPAPPSSGLWSCWK
jgi:hypothetical protein